jgi:hypothetical protein
MEGQPESMTGKREKRRINGFFMASLDVVGFVSLLPVISKIFKFLLSAPHEHAYRDHRRDLYFFRQDRKDKWRNICDCFIELNSSSISLRFGRDFTIF